MDSLKIKEIPLNQLLPAILEHLKSGHSVRFSPRGSSMLPMLRQGIDSVQLSPLPSKLKKYDLVLYQRDNGQYVLHRICRVGKTYTCIGDNQFIMEPELRHDQMIAVVCSFTRGDRSVSVDQFSYRVYCRFWHYSRPVRRLWRGGISWLRRHKK